MAKKTHFDRISELMADIRNTISVHHNFVDGRIKKYNTQMASDEARLNQTALDFETRKNKVILQGDIKYSSNQSVRSLEISFGDIQTEINAWAVEPPGSDFLTLMETVSTFDLDLTVDELRALSQSASGSYFAEKVLSGYAEKRSDIRYPFETLDSLEQMIRNAKADCILAVKAYAGDLSGNSIMGWVTDDLGRFQTHHRILAAEYLSRDETSLSRLEDALSTATDKTISLVPNEQQRIAKMFDDVLPEDRFHHMQSLILEHPELEKKLSLFDPDCYKSAKEEIRNQTEQERLNALAAVREASRKAQQAHEAAVMASLG